MRKKSPEAPDKKRKKKSRFSQDKKSPRRARQGQKHQMVETKKKPLDSFDKDKQPEAPDG